jgi:hypothetical protein
MYKFKMSVKGNEQHEYNRAKFISINKAGQVAQLVIKDKNVVEVKITDNSGRTLLVLVS